LAATSLSADEVTNEKTNIRKWKVTGVTFRGADSGSARRVLKACLACFYRVSRCPARRSVVIFGTGRRADPFDAAVIFCDRVARLIEAFP
jgi:hypothetical protein